MGLTPRAGSSPAPGTRPGRCFETGQRLPITEHDHVHQRDVACDLGFCGTLHRPRCYRPQAMRAHPDGGHPGYGVCSYSGDLVVPGGQGRPLPLASRSRCGRSQLGSNHESRPGSRDVHVAQPRLPRPIRWIRDSSWSDDLRRRRGPLGWGLGRSDRTRAAKMATFPVNQPLTRTNGATSRQAERMESV